MPFKASAFSTTLELGGTIGTSDLDLSGASYAVDLLGTGFPATFPAIGAGQDTLTLSFGIYHLGAGEWEESRGVYTHGTTTLARTTVERSSTGSKVNFSAGAVRVYVGPTGARWDEVATAAAQAEAADRDWPSNAFSVWPDSPVKFVAPVGSFSIDSNRAALANEASFFLTTWPVSDKNIDRLRCSVLAGSAGPIGLALYKFTPDLSVGTRLVRDVSSVTSDAAGNKTVTFTALEPLFGSIIGVGLYTQAAATYISLGGIRSDLRFMINFNMRTPDGMFRTDWSISTCWPDPFTFSGWTSYSGSRPLFVAPGFS